MQAPHLILGVGELLWDILPAGTAPEGIPLPPLPPQHPRGQDVADSLPAGIPTANSPRESLPLGLPGEVPSQPRTRAKSVGLLGGAPANFAVMAGRLGNHAAILSRIGRDDLGRLAIDTLNPLPVDTSLIEIDPVHETGRVDVEFLRGEPSYVIHRPAAWDFLQLSDDWVRMAERADALCFGTLAQRHPVSRQTIQTLAAQTPARCIRVLDVNLRPPFLSGEVMQESLELATVLKLNQDELPRVLTMIGVAPIEESARDALLSAARRLLREFPGLRLVAVTRGQHGSLLVNREMWDDHPGTPVKVADGIGAGDAFTAALTHYMLRGAPLHQLNEAGNRWGAWVASQPGAMPPLPDSVLQSIASAVEQ